MVEFSPEEEQTEFNQSIDVLYKIADVRKQICKHIYFSEYLSQFMAQKVYYYLLQPMLNDPEILEQETQQEKCRMSIKKLKELLSKNKKQIDYEIIENLDDWFKKLNMHAQKHGLLMIKKRDARYALSGK